MEVTEELRRSSRRHDRDGGTDVTEPEKKRQKIQNDKPTVVKVTFYNVKDDCPKKPDTRAPRITVKKFNETHINGDVTNLFNQYNNPLNDHLFHNLFDHKNYTYKLLKNPNSTDELLDEKEMYVEDPNNFRHSMSARRNMPDMLSVYDDGALKSVKEFMESENMTMYDMYVPLVVTEKPASLSSSSSSSSNTTTTTTTTNAVVTTEEVPDTTFKVNLGSDGVVCAKNELRFLSQGVLCSFEFPDTITFENLKMKLLMGLDEGLANEKMYLKMGGNAYGALELTEANFKTMIIDSSQSSSRQKTFFIGFNKIEATDMTGRTFKRLDDINVTGPLNPVRDASVFKPVQQKKLLVDGIIKAIEENYFDPNCPHYHKLTRRDLMLARTKLNTITSVKELERLLLQIKNPLYDIRNYFTITFGNHPPDEDKIPLFYPRKKPNEKKDSNGGSSNDAINNMIQMMLARQMERMNNTDNNNNNNNNNQNNNTLNLWQQQQQAIQRIQLNDNLSLTQKSEQIQACKEFYAAALRP